MGSLALSDEQRAENRAKRAHLKACRAQLTEMLDDICHELDDLGTSTSVSSHRSARSLASQRSARSERPGTQASQASQRSSAGPVLLGAARPPSEPFLRPPVIDPKAVVPAHIRAQFEAEFDAQQAERRGSGASSVAPPPPKAWRADRPHGPACPPDLESYLQSIPGAPKPPSREVLERPRGGKAAGGTFVQYTGSQTLASPEGPKKGRKKIDSAQAAQSTIGRILDER